MPNFVKVDSKPFHPDTYVGPEHEEDFLGGTHERDMGIKLRVENTVRWRWTKDKDDRDVSPLTYFAPYYEDLKSPWWRRIGSRTRTLSDGRMAA
jgi:Leo1-like protein